MPLNKKQQQLLKETLKLTGFYSFMTEAELDELHNSTSLITFERGDCIIREGTQGESFYIIAEGKVSLSKKDFEDNELFIGQINPGDFFGEMALITNANRTTTVIARELVTVFSICKKEFVEILLKNSKIRSILEFECNFRSKDLRKKVGIDRKALTRKPIGKASISQKIVELFKDYLLIQKISSNSEYPSGSSGLELNPAYKTKFIENEDIKREIEELKSLKGKV